MNLYYACNRCNSNKGDFWPTPREAKAKVFVPNPCDYVMADHLGFRMGTIVHRSRAGQFTTELLDLNETAIVQLREALIQAVALLDERIRSLKATVEQIEKIRKRARAGAEKVKIETQLTRAKNNLQKVQSARAQFA